MLFFFAKEKNDRMKLSSLIKYRINERNIIHSLPFQQENFGIYNTIFPRKLENVFCEHYKYFTFLEYCTWITQSVSQAPCTENAFRLLVSIFLFWTIWVWVSLSNNMPLLITSVSQLSPAWHSRRVALLWFSTVLLK